MSVSISIATVLEGGSGATIAAMDLVAGSYPAGATALTVISIHHKGVSNAHVWWYWQVNPESGVITFGNLAICVVGR